MADLAVPLGTMRCGECGGTDISLDARSRSSGWTMVGEAVSMNVLVWAGCNECSSTLWQVKLDDFLRSVEGMMQVKRRRVASRFKPPVVEAP